MGVSSPLFKRSNRNHPRRSLRAPQPDIPIEAEPRRFLDHRIFEAQACPGFDPGQAALSVKKMRQNKRLHPDFESV
jgi:hypothetical protein